MLRPILIISSVLSILPAGAATAQTPVVPSADNGGAQPVEQPPAARPRKIRARILANGKAWISPDAPAAVRKIILAGNQIVGRPYSYGGGHTSFRSLGYDCSGTVSYALHGAKLVHMPLASGDLMSWGKRGRGRWITVYANGGHAFMQVAGIRLDTSRQGDSRGGKGPRWRKLLTATPGYTQRHPRGL